MELVNVFDYERLAHERLDPGTWAYFAGGSDDEVTLRVNRSAFEHLQFRPRVLVDISTLETKTSVLGTPVAMPILAAPVGFQALAHPDGECATACATTATGTLLVVSTFSSSSLEAIAQAASGPRWFQLAAPTRLWTERLVERAIAAGYGALVLTVDAARDGNKERAIRQDFHLPTSKANFGDEPVGNNFTALPTWESLTWLRSRTSLPLVLKGILTAEDAHLAVEHGIDGIIVSNHGGRQLDGVPATLEVLSEIVEAVHGHSEVYLDGGIRRGTDVLKALALGARAVLIGRPILWGLAVNGMEGVQSVLELLRTELERAMALLGCPTVAQVNPSFLRIKIRS